MKLINCNLKKVIFILIAIILIMFNMIPFCNANKIVDTNYEISPISVEPELLNTAGIIIGAIRLFGTIMSVLMIATIGILYMTSAPEGKADYKKNAYPYIVGAALLFGGSNIVQFIYNAVH